MCGVPARVRKEGTTTTPTTHGVVHPAATVGRIKTPCAKKGTMAAENYFADSMTATIDTEDATPVSIPVGSLKQVQVTVEAEHVELTSADTILRDNVAKRNLNVSVTAGVAAFDDTIVQEWLGGDGAAATSPVDDNSVATFTLTGTITSADNAETVTATVDGLFFPSLPVIDSQEGQWIQHNYEGDGKTISLV